jgi:hypothetical protein
MGEWKRTVDLAPGQKLTLRGSVLQPVIVRVGVTDGDGVRVAGRVHANGTTFELRPDRYRIDVVKGGKARTGRWITIPRVASCTLRDQPAIDCYAPKP